MIRRAFALVAVLVLAACNALATEPQLTPQFDLITGDWGDVQARLAQALVRLDNARDDADDQIADWDGFDGYTLVTNTIVTVKNETYGAYTDLDRAYTHALNEEYDETLYDIEKYLQDLEDAAAWEAWAFTNLAKSLVSTSGYHTFTDSIDGDQPVSYQWLYDSTDSLENDATIRALWSASDMGDAQDELPAYPITASNYLDHEGGGASPWLGHTGNCDPPDCSFATEVDNARINLSPTQASVSTEIVGLLTEGASWGIEAGWSLFYVARALDDIGTEIIEEECDEEDPECEN